MFLAANLHIFNVISERKMLNVIFKGDLYSALMKKGLLAGI